MHEIERGAILFEHNFPSHSTVLVLENTHSAPPPFGLGLLQRRLIVIRPDPQVFEHGDVFSQAPHLPSTKSKYKKVYNALF